MTALNVCGCNRFLDREQESFIDLDKTYTSYERTSQALVNVYRFLPDGLNRIGTAMYDAATDDGETPSKRAISRNSTMVPGALRTILTIFGTSFIPASD